MKVDWKEYAAFIVTFFGSTWGAQQLLSAVSIVDPLTATAVSIIVPGSLLYFVWHRWIKKAVD